MLMCFKKTFFFIGSIFYLKELNFKSNLHLIEIRKKRENKKKIKDYTTFLLDTNDSELI
jgi:hypothetical protein